MTKTKAKIRSLTQIDPAVHADKGFEFEIVDTTTSEGVGMFITVTGQDGSAYQEIARKQLNAQLAQKGDAKPQTIEKMVEQTIDTCTACTKGWRGVVIDEAEGELEFNEANARRLYALRFVRDQAIKAIEDRANFTGG